VNSRSAVCSPESADSTSASNEQGCASSGKVKSTPTQARSCGVTGQLFPTLEILEESQEKDYGHGGIGILPTPSASMAERGGRGDLLQVIRGNPSPSGHFRTFFAAASPARTSATRASGQGSMASAADYGASSPVLLANYDRATRSWRTSQLCLDGEWSEFSETWPRSGMTRNGIAYQLPPLVRLTDGIESGSWPTPTCMDAAEKPMPPRRFNPSGGQAPPLISVIGGSLNPTWVEWLMGYPAEWTVCDASAMPSSRKSRKSSAEPSLAPTVSLCRPADKEGE
jgi:hypothetical protein